MDEIWETVDVTVRPLDSPYYSDREQLLVLPDLVEGETLRARIDCSREQIYTVTPALEVPEGFSLTVTSERTPRSGAPDRFEARVRIQSGGRLAEYAFTWRAYINLDGIPNVTTGPRVVFPDPTYRIPLACEGGEGVEPGPHELSLMMGPAGGEPTTVFTGIFALTCPEETVVVDTGSGSDAGLDASESDGGCSTLAGSETAPLGVIFLAVLSIRIRRRS